jgi:hypothetical protein
MSDFEVRRDKTKAFKCSQETLEKLEEMIKKSGKGHTEYFEELVNDLAIKSVVSNDNEEISPDLRRHFESDVQKLKNATSSIVSIFVSQMENIVVEKNQWKNLTEKQLNERQETINSQATKYEGLKLKFEEREKLLFETIKEKDALEKESDVLAKRTEDQKQLIQDRSEKIIELNERIAKLNENIVDKDDQLKAVEPIKKELKVLEEKNVQLENGNVDLLQQMEQLKESHLETLEKQKEALDFQYEKQQYNLEKELTEKFSKEKEEVRNEVRRETEQNIREFYLAEIQRKENEFQTKEEEYKKQIESLQEQIRGL